MKTTPPHSLLWAFLCDLRLQLVLAVGVPTLLLLTLPALPITDMPEHSLAIAGLRDALFGGTALPLAHNLRSSPYLAYHISGALLAKLCGSAEWANRLLLLVVALGFPLSLRRALIAFGAPASIAWFGILPFFSRALSIGFLPYLSSVPVGLLLLAESPVERALGGEARAATPLRRTLTMAALASALFYSHISSFSIFVPAALMVAALSRLSAEAPPWRKCMLVLQDSLWVLPSALLALRFVVLGRLSTRVGEGLEQTEVATMAFTRRLHAFPLWLFDNFRANGDDVMAVCYWVLFLVALILSYRAVFQRKLSLKFAHAIPALVAFGVYVLTPFQVGAAAFLNVRLAPILVLLLLPMFRAPLPRWLQSCIAIVSVAGGLTFYAYAYGLYQVAGAAMMKAVAAVPAGARVVTLNFDEPIEGTYLDPFVYAGSIAVARAGGVAGFSFASLPHWSVQYRAGDTPPAHEPFWIFDPCSFRNSRDGEFFDHVMVRGDLNPFANKPFGPVFELAYDGGRYKLYRKMGHQRWAASEGAGQDDGPCTESAPRLPRSYAP